MSAEQQLRQFSDFLTGSSLRIHDTQSVQWLRLNDEELEANLADLDEDTRGYVLHAIETGKQGQEELNQVLGEIAERLVNQVAAEAKLQRLESCSPEFWRALRKRRKVVPFDLGGVFIDLCEMYAQGEISQTEAIQRKVLLTALNLWSLRQEVTGEKSTIEVITRIFVEQGQVQFGSDVHAAKNLLEMYESSVDSEKTVPVLHRPRYRRENEQLRRRWQTVSQPLSLIDFSLPTDRLAVQLTSLGFHQVEIEITPSLITNIPSLRDQVKTVDDFARIVERRQKVKVWVAPDHQITISPPHWLHSRGKSSFIWDSQLTIIAETKEVFIREHGLFSYSPLKVVRKALGWRQETTPVLASESDIMNYINIVTNLGHVPPQVVLEQIVQSLTGFVPAQKMDKNVVEGPFNIRPFMQSIQALYEYELQRCLVDSSFLAGSYERLQLFADKLRHLAALNDTKGIDEMLQKYKQLYGNKQAAIHPHFVARAFDSAAKVINPKFAIPINWSLFDCVAGTPFSLMNKLSPAQIDAQFGKGASMELAAYHARGLQSRHEVTAFCQKYGKDPSLYSKYGECAMCHRPTYIWPMEAGGCNVCPVCEVMDDLGFKEGEMTDLNSLDHLPHGYDSKEVENGVVYGRMGLSDFFASLATPTIRISANQAN